MAYCGKCGNRIKKGQNFCGRCGERVRKTVKPRKERKPGRNGKDISLNRIIVFSIIGVVVIAVAVAAGLMLSRGRRGDPGNNALYIKDGKVFSSVESKKNGARQITSEMEEVSDSQVEYYGNGSEVARSRQSYISKNGKFILTPDTIIDDAEAMSLFYQDLSHSGAEKTEIGSELYGYTVNDEETIVTYCTEDNSLYQYTIGKEDQELIANSIEDYCFWVSSDGSRVIFLDDTGSLYLKEGGKETELIACDVSEVVRVMNDVSTVYYLDAYDSLYKKAIAQEEAKIGDDVCVVIRAYDSGELYYVKEAEEKPISYFVNDDMREADDAIVEPEEPQYPEVPVLPTPPISSSFDTEEEYEAAYKAYEAENKAAKAEFDAYQAECDRITDEYREAKNAYLEKEARDELRAALESERVQFSPGQGSLFYYDGSEERLLSGYCIMDLLSFPIQALTSTPVITFRSYEVEKIEKIPFSDIENVDDFYTLFQPLWIDSKMVNVAVGDTVNSLDDFESYLAEVFGWWDYDDRVENEIMLADTFVVYVTPRYDEEDNLEECNLYKVPIVEKRLGKPELFDSNDDGIIQLISLDKNQLVYLKSIDPEPLGDENSIFNLGTGPIFVGDLYINGEKVDENVVSYIDPLVQGVFQDLNGADTLLYFTDFDYDREEYGECTLKAYKDGKVVTIMDGVPILTDFNVYEEAGMICFATAFPSTLYVYGNNEAVDDLGFVQSYTVCPGGRILYLCDYDRSVFKGTLKEWIDGKSRIIDEGVSYLIRDSEIATKYRGVNEWSARNYYADLKVLERDDYNRYLLRGIRQMMYDDWRKKVTDS